MSILDVEIEKGPQIKLCAGVCQVMKKLDVVIAGEMWLPEAKQQACLTIGRTIRGLQDHI